MTLTYDPQWNWHNEALDDAYDRELRDRASEWPEPPEDWGEQDSIDAQEAREEAENGA